MVTLGFTAMPNEKVALFIKPQTAATWAERAKRLADEDDAPMLLP